MSVCALSTNNAKLNIVLSDNVCIFRVDSVSVYVPVQKYAVVLFFKCMYRLCADRDFCVYPCMEILILCLSLHGNTYLQIIV